MKQINIWVTNECNMRCTYCYEGEKKHKQLKEINKVIEFIRESCKEEKKTYINFHGGEPLLNFDYIYKLCVALKEAKTEYIFSMTTNALLLGSSVADKIKELGIFVSVSLDGNKRNHDRNRVDCWGKGTYERVCKAINLLLERNIDFRVRMTITSNNFDELRENVMSIWNLGVDEVVAAPDYFCDGWTYNKLRSLKEDIIFLHQKGMTVGKKFDFLNQGIVGRKSCQGGKESCNINSDMKIYPCVYSVGNSKYEIGDVEKGIQQDKVMKFIQAWDKVNEECIGCTYIRYCTSTRCKLLNEVLTGDEVKTSPIVCAFENMMYDIYCK